MQKNNIVLIVMWALLAIPLSTVAELESGLNCVNSQKGVQPNSITDWMNSKHS